MSDAQPAASAEYLVGRMHDDFGDEVSVYAFPSVAGLFTGRVVIETTRGISLGHGKQDEFAKLYTEACRRADGQPDGRPCCGHCDHGDGPGGHDPGDPTAHDGPCPSCQAEAAGHG